jgi:hypothetical protein
MTRFYIRGKPEDVAVNSIKYPVHPRTVVSHSPHCATMLRAAFLGCTFILPALFASAIAGELDFEFETLVANNVQIPLNISDDYQYVCHSISRSISPASQVFYPGAVLAFLSYSKHYPSPLLIFRFSPIRGRYRSLGQLEFTDIRMLREAWHSRGPEFYRS